MVQIFSCSHRNLAIRSPPDRQVAPSPKHVLGQHVEFKLYLKLNFAEIFICLIICIILSYKSRHNELEPLALTNFFYRDVRKDLQVKLRIFLSFFIGYFIFSLHIFMNYINFNYKVVSRAFNRNHGDFSEILKFFTLKVK